MDITRGDRVIYRYVIIPRRCLFALPQSGNYSLPTPYSPCGESTKSRVYYIPYAEDQAQIALEKSYSGHCLQQIFAPS